MYQAAPDTSKQEPVIMIDGAPLKTVGDFTYLGSCISSSGTLDKEIFCRLAKACLALRPWLYRLSWGGQVMWCAWKIAAFQNSSSAPNWPEVQENKEIRSSAIKTPLSSPCGPVWHSRHRLGGTCCQVYNRPFPELSKNFKFQILQLLKFCFDKSISNFFVKIWTNLLFWNKSSNFRFL